MLDDLAITVQSALGLNEDSLDVHHMALRAIVVFTFAVVIVRLGKKRFIGENTAFDVILGVMLGSILSRAITGQSPFVPTLGAALVLVALHWVLSKIAIRSELFGTLIKGSARTLVTDGVVDWKAMKRSNLSEGDLREALRLKARLSGWAQVREARLERNGEISVILKEE